MQKSSCYFYKVSIFQNHFTKQDGQTGDKGRPQNGLSLFKSAGEISSLCKGWRSISHLVITIYQIKCQGDKYSDYHTNEKHLIPCKQVKLLSIVTFSKTLVPIAQASSLLFCFIQIKFDQKHVKSFY